MATATEAYVPTEDEINAAIDAKNADLIARYALSVQRHRRDQAERLPSLLQKCSDAKRDLDVCKAVIKNADQTVSLMQSVLKTLRPGSW